VGLRLPPHSPAPLGRHGGARLCRRLPHPGAARSRTSALDFSIQAAWKWTYGWEKTRGWLRRGIALGEQAAVKVLLLLFAKALANTSPLLKEITDKVLPFS